MKSHTLKGSYKGLAGLLCNPFRVVYMIRYPIPGCAEYRVPWAGFFYSFSVKSVKSGTVCAVKRCLLSAGAIPARQLLLRPVAIEAVLKVTTVLKPSMERTSKWFREKSGTAHVRSCRLSGCVVVS
jgi:hypothetical protein